MVPKDGHLEPAGCEWPTVTPGAYTYKVTALRRGTAAVKRGTVRVKRPPAPAPAPAPDPTVPATETTPAPDPSPAPAPEPSPASDRLVGYWVPGSPSDMAPLEALEAQIGRRAGVVNFFIADTESFPASRCQNIVDHGAVPLVTLEFWSTSNGGVESITAGSKDAYLRAFADRAREFGSEIWLRPLHEMNGNWYPWGGSASGNSPAEVVAAWRHVHDIFESRGATNVKMVWCVNNDSVPYTTANGIARYWPGDAYVDYTSIDGYNAGTTQSWSTWRSFGATFRNAYNTITGLSAKPIVIAETSSVEQGGSKSAWIRDMFTSLETEFPQVRAVVWFNERKTYDWRIESASANVAVFRAGAAGF